MQALYKKLKYHIFFNLPADVLYRQHNSESISQKGFNKINRKSQLYFLYKHHEIAKKIPYSKNFKKLAFTLGVKNAKSRLGILRDSGNRKGAFSKVGDKLSLSSRAVEERYYATKKILDAVLLADIRHKESIEQHKLFEYGR